MPQDSVSLWPRETSTMGHDWRSSFGFELPPRSPSKKLVVMAKFVPSDSGSFFLCRTIFLRWSMGMSGQLRVVRQWCSTERNYDKDNFWLTFRLIIDEHEVGSRRKVGSGQWDFRPWNLVLERWNVSIELRGKNCHKRTGLRMVTPVEK